MVSTYHGIETGRSAITYFRKSMEIAGVNTTKANNEGYSRQVVNHTTSPALSSSPVNTSHLGTGVEITSIERMRDLYLDTRKRRAVVEQTYWQTMTTGMQRVDALIAGTNDVGLNNLLDSFWTSIQDVHKNPDNQAVRNVAVTSADALVQFSGSLSAGYGAYRNELNNDVRAMVESANGLIDQIAVLNRGITQTRLAGGEPNELLDKRDLLVDRLCELTGATASTETDERDNDFKVTIGGRMIVQGTQTRHLMLIPNPADNGYYQVQIEYNQYDITSNPDVVGVVTEQRADDLRPVDGSCTMDGTHEMEVVRTADELYWTVGHGLGQLEGGSRMDGISGSNVPLDIDGSFALQVGSGGVRAYSEVFSKNPPGVGVVLGKPGPGEATSYAFRVAAGAFETTITATWDANHWELSDNANPPNVWDTDTDANLRVDEFVNFFNTNPNYLDSGIVAKNDGDALVLESVDRRIISVTDIEGTLMQSSGLANENPIVRIDVTVDDTLQTIANKINNAYKFDKAVSIEGEGEDQTEKRLLFYNTVPPETAPSSPEQWMHASVELDEKGQPYLCLTSNAAGEANRINVMSGSVCGDDSSNMTVARRLGLVEYNDKDDDGTVERKDVTSYIQLDRANGKIISRDTKGGDVFVDDAYFRYDGVEYLSDANTFKDARQIAKVGEARADVLDEFSPGIRAEINGVGTSTITVRHHLREGAIYSALKLRDDVLLSHTDVFDDMMYKLATEFNANHYAGYGYGKDGEGAYANVTGMAFFDAIPNRYGAFGELNIDANLLAPNGEIDSSRLAAISGDGKGKALGEKDGWNALMMAQLKQEKIFMSGTADFDTLYRNFVASYSSFGERSGIMNKNQGYIVEQVEVQRKQIMGVNSSEEMMTMVTMNQGFNHTSQYISTLMQIIDQMISGLGRVGI